MPPFDNPDVRQALRYAINYDNIITLLGGNGELVQEIIPIGFAGHTGNNPFTQDLESATELFANAGVTEGAVIPFIGGHRHRTRRRRLGDHRRVDPG
jgi:peptide/nickel transport system substrate-binding protein